MEKLEVKEGENICVIGYPRKYANSSNV